MKNSRTSYMLCLKNWTQNTAHAQSIVIGLLCVKKPAETYSEAAKDWKLLEIAIERNDRKTQKTLFEDAILVDNFRDRLGSKENHVAEYYIRTKYGVPYYFGFQKLASLASSNIQQFLYLSSDLFDEMIIAKRGFDNIHISPARQEEILRKAVDRRWTDIIQSVSRFVESSGIS